MLITSYIDATNIITRSKPECMTFQKIIWLLLIIGLNHTIVKFLSKLVLSLSSSIKINKQIIFKKPEKWKTQLTALPSTLQTNKLADCITLLNTHLASRSKALSELESSFRTLKTLSINKSPQSIPKIKRK